MATKWISPTWRMPEESNQSKLDNYSLKWEGTSGRIECGDDVGDAIGDNYQGGMAISTWFKCDNTSVSSGVGLMYFKNGGGSGYGEINIYVASNTLYLYIHGSLKTLGSFTDTTSWHHLLINITGSTTSTNQAYLDGSAFGSAFSFTSSGLDLAGEDLYIGTYDGTDYWQGDINNVSIFDYALSETQINYLYNSGTPQNPMAIPGNSPIAYYDLGGSSTGDAAASSPNTLTVPNSSVPSATVFDFVPNDDVNMGHIDFFDGATTLSISGWFNFDDISANRDLISQWAGTTTNGSFVLRRSSGNLLALFIRTGGSSSGSDYYYANLGTSSTGHSVGVWYNLALTLDNGTCVIYLNGQPLSTSIGGSPQATLQTSTADFELGNWQANSTRFDGKMSNIQLWSSKLEPSEITTLYNNGRPYLGTQPQAANLKGWWKMNIDNSEYSSKSTDWNIQNSFKPIEYKKALEVGDGKQAKINLGNNFWDAYRNPSEPLVVSTISLWIKVKVDISGNVYAGLTEIMGNNYGGIRLNQNDLFFVFGSGYVRWDVPTLNNDAFHHIALVIPDATDKNTAKLYINGEDQESSKFTSGTTPQNPTYPMQYCNFGFGINGQCYSLISNIQIFTTALGETGTESITSLYNEGQPKDVTGWNNLIGWWKVSDSTWNGSQWDVPATVGNDAVTFTNGTGQFSSTSLKNVDVNASVATSSGMNTANLVNSDLERSIPYSSYSMYFDGSGDEINFSSTNDLGLNNTVSMWVNLDSGYSGALLGESSYASTGYFLLPYATGFFVRIGATYVSVPNVHTYLTAGSWHHLTVVRNAGNFLFYVDGAFIETVALSSTTATKFDIIGNSHTGADPIEGKISNVCSFNYILTEDQILTIYNGGVPNDISSLSPTGWWSLAGDSYYNGADWICPDLSSNSNNGTSSGMGGDELVGDGPGSTANGLGTGMNIPGNLQGNAPNSSSNAFSVNMNADDKSTSVPDIS